jgi:hypothetical protein
MVAVLLEQLRQRDRVGVRLAEQVPIMPRPVVVGQASGEERGARRPADRLHGVGPVEDARLARQPVEVRRDRQRVAVAPERNAQVVDGDEQDVGPDPVRRGDDGGRQDGEHEGQSETA